MLKEIVGYCQLGFAAIGGALGWFIGGLDGFLYALIAFVVIDYLTGLLAAGVQKKLSSEVGFKGIAKKIAIFLLVGIANIIDVDVIQNGTALRTAVIFFYLSNEGLSILENAGNIGLPIPETLKTLLAQLKDKEDDQK